MESEEKSSPAVDVEAAARHVAGAHKLLKQLQERLGQHPEIGQAVNKLENALAILDLQTGGML